MPLIPRSVDDSLAAEVVFPSRDRIQGMAPTRKRSANTEKAASFCVGEPDLSPIFRRNKKIREKGQRYEC